MNATLAQDPMKHQNCRNILSAKEHKTCEIISKMDQERVIEKPKFTPTCNSLLCRKKEFKHFRTWKPINFAAVEGLIPDRLNAYLKERNRNVEELKQQTQYSRCCNWPALPHFHYLKPPILKDWEPQNRNNQRDNNERSSCGALKDSQNRVKMGRSSRQQAHDTGEIVEKLLHLLCQRGELGNHLWKKGWCENMSHLKTCNRLLVFSVSHLSACRSCRAWFKPQKSRCNSRQLIKQPFWEPKTTQRARRTWKCE